MRRCALSRCRALSLGGNLGAGRAGSRWPQPPIQLQPKSAARQHSLAGTQPPRHGAAASRHGAAAASAPHACTVAARRGTRAARRARAPQRRQRVLERARPGRVRCAAVLHQHLVREELGRLAALLHVLRRRAHAWPRRAGRSRAAAARKLLQLLQLLQLCLVPARGALALYVCCCCSAQHGLPLAGWCRLVTRIQALLRSLCARALVQPRHPHSAFA